MGNNRRIPLKENKMVSIFFLQLVFASLFSALPNWSFSLWLINIGIVLVSMIIVIFSWLTMRNSKRYFSILSYWMIFTMAVCGAEPLIRTLWSGKNGMWVYFVLVWFFLFVILHFFREKVFQVFKDPFKTKGEIIFHLLLAGAYPLNKEFLKKDMAPH